jgi:multiple sugar transport system substrate-binding protein
MNRDERSGAPWPPMTRRCALGGLAASGSGLLAACGAGGTGAGGSGASAVSKAPATLRYMAWFFQDFSGIDDVIRVYRDKHPNVTVEKEHVPSAEFTTKQAANFVAGTAADAMWGEGMQFPKFHDNNWTLDLTEHAKVDKLNLRRDYALVGVELWCDRVRALPMQVGPRAFYYNKALLESVGAKDPWDDLKGEWTWDDLVTAAQKVARDTNGDGRNDQWGLQIPLTGLSEGYAMWAWTLGGAPADYKNMRFTFTTPLFREAAQFVFDLAVRQRLIVTDDELAELRGAGVRDAFVGGKVAFFLRASPNVGTTLRDVGSSFPWDIAPFPKKDARRPGVALSSGNPNIIWSGTKAPEAAYSWLRFLAGPETQGLFASTKIYTPALKSVWKAYETPIPGGPQHIGVFTDVYRRPYGIHFYHHNTVPSTAPFAAEMREALAGRKSLDAALRDAEQQGNQQVAYGECLPFKGMDVPIRPS